MKAYWFVLFFAIASVALASQSPQCKKDQGTEYHLRQAGIAANDATRYAGILKQHKIDQTILPTLTIAQLQNIGISVLGDRLKIHNYFSADTDDCGSNTCKRGRCIDGFNCFYCRCDETGYYGPNCGIKCPCLNGAACRDTLLGFKCVCPPGYKGDLCQSQWLNEDRFTSLESQVKQLSAQLKKAQSRIASQEVTLKAAKAKLDKTGWNLVRVDEVLNKLIKISLHQATPTYDQKMPFSLPNNAKAIIVSLYFFYQGPVSKHGYLSFDISQKGNEKTGKAHFDNTHYDVHYNTWYYEFLLPWNSALKQELVVKVTSSYNTAIGQNWYQLKLKGYIKA